MNENDEAHTLPGPVKSLLEEIQLGAAADETVLFFSGRIRTLPKLSRREDLSRAFLWYIFCIDHRAANLRPQVLSALYGNGIAVTHLDGQRL